MARGGSRINFRVLQNFTKKKMYCNEMRHIKGILLSIILTKAASKSKRGYHGMTWVAQLSEQKAIFKNLL